MRRVIVAVVLLAALLGICTQAHWDAQCNAAQPGATWNADLWDCSK